MLTLPIKKKWYDMILSGEKKEEYREPNKYYRTRFTNIELITDTGLTTSNTAVIAFRNGYRKDSPTFTAECSLRYGMGKPEWGAEKGGKYYILSIIKIIERK